MRTERPAPPNRAPGAADLVRIRVRVTVRVRVTPQSPSNARRCRPVCV